MNPTTLKTIILALGVALGAVAAAPIEGLDQFDAALGPISAALVAWAGLRRPGDEAPPKATDK